MKFTNVSPDGNGMGRRIGLRSRLRRRLLLAGSALVAAGRALAQAAKLPQAFSEEAVAPELERPVGEDMPLVRTSGQLELKGKQFFIADYQLLFEQSGEVPVAPPGQSLFGRRLPAPQATLAYRIEPEPEIEVLQALTDRAWADLMARLKAAGVTVAQAEDVALQHGLVHVPTVEATTASKRKITELRSGAGFKRYVVMSPNGTALVARSPTGLGTGNLVARVNWVTKNLEGLSIAFAVNFSRLDLSGRRRSTYTADLGSDPASPLIEVVPAPAMPLVLPHTHRAQITLSEPVAMAGEFARMQPVDEAKAASAAPPSSAAPATGAAPSSAAAPPAAAAPAVPALPRIHAEIELDGPPTVRIALYAIAATNQAIADALKDSMLA